MPIDTQFRFQEGANGKADRGQKGKQGGRSGGSPANGKGKQAGGRGNNKGGNAGKAAAKGAEAEAVEVPVVAPEAPTVTKVEGSLAGVIVNFNAAFDGNSPITTFTVTAAPGNVSASGASSPVVVEGLTAGTAYTFTVTATNEAKMTSPASAASEAFTVKPAVLYQLLDGAEAEQAKAAAAVADAVAATGGLFKAETDLLLSEIRSAFESDNKQARTGASLAFKALLEAGPKGEALCYEMLPLLMARLGDKHKPARVTADACMETLMGHIDFHTIRPLISTVVSQVNAYAWQASLAAVKMITKMATTAPAAVATHLEIIVPALASVMCSTKKAVADAVTEALAAVCATIENRDVKPFVPALVSCMARPLEVPEAVNSLAGTTFVQTVTAPVLSIMVPVLVRGLREGTTAVKRQTCVIIDNFAKLVEDPNDVTVFLPKLLPGVERASAEVPDPECRQVAARALATLKRVAGSAAPPTLRLDDEARIATMLATSMAVKEADLTAPAAVVLRHAACLAAALVSAGNFAEDAWTALTPFLAPLAGEEAKAAAAVKEASVQLKKDWEAAQAGVEEEDDDGEDLCNCEFSLAYGSKILLNAARLRLKRGRRYGLVGPNGVGKSTLMRAIVEGQLDGFPPPTELRTVYVECDISPDLAELNVTDFVLADPKLKDSPRDEVAKTLATVGFNETMQVAPVSSLSGGWRMKLALARAMLKKADILLLDEPTNHLDVANVTWVVDYLTSLTEVTSVIVTHDSGFLERSCTDIIHFNYLKLKNYHCTLSEFVAQVPEAKAYYELKSDTLVFKFPEPGFLEGVKSRGRAVLKMSGVGFTYPGTTRRILRDININVSMASRCAVVGPNGAGKSTMIKLLTGELVPDEGTVWKHPNLVLAYVAQHAFHHIENHLQETANEYIRWRFRGGEDREGVNKVANMITEEEEELMRQVVVVEGEKRVIKRLLSRRKGKRGDEYEVEFKDKPSSCNVFWSREKLAKLGWEKPCRKIDRKVLAEQTNSVARPLNATEVEKHLADLGLEAEFATHTRIDSLSTSQKVKVVLAAATWNNPNIIVLDEPTNYLDRESLGALAQAIRDFNGGVVMISHNSEFTGALCPETWHMKDGHLHAEGASVDAENDTALDQEQATEGVDGLGNEYKVKIKKKTMSRKERKAYEKRRAAKIANGQSVSSSDDEE